MSGKGFTREELFEYVRNEYGTEPEYPWSSSPEHGVLRHSNNRKWYAIVMKISPEKLGLAGEKMLDIVNVKVSPLMTGSLLMCEGIFPAYHMNKTNWVSLLLGESADGEQIKALIDSSYELTKTVSRKKSVDKA